MSKIICVGHQKTGTSSLTRALKNLGFSVGSAPNKILTEVHWDAPDLRSQIEKITIGILEENDAIQDSPCAHFHKELDKAFPGSKFILTTRDPENWLNSYQQYFGNRNNNLRKWMYGVDRLVGNEQAILEVYHRKNKEIMAYFSKRPDDFLVLDLEKGDGWLKLVTFLGDDFLKPFPHVNKSTAR